MKKSWQERAWELLEEQRKERPAEREGNRLRWENWQELLKHAVAFAEQEIRRRRWRGEKKGVLPEGADANSVAAAATRAMLEGKARLALGWTRERLERELERQVSNEVRRLHSLREASRMRSERRVVPPREGVEPESVFEGMAGSMADGAEAAMRAEGAAKAERLQREIAGTLAEDGEARDVFKCLCEGVVKRREIARKLGMEVWAVSRARRRLDTKLDQFREKHPECPRGFIEELKRL